MKKVNGSILLLIGAFIWGSTFVAQSKGMDYIGPHTYNAARFLVGTLVLTPVSLYFCKKEKVTNVNYKQCIKHSIIVGLIIGIPEIIASATQQIGISGTSAAKAGFITALYIVFVPLLGLFFKKKVPWNCWLAVIIALIGFYFLSFTEVNTINQYDLYLVVCAIFFSVQILAVDLLAKDCISVIVTQMMFLVCAIVSIFLMFLLETPSWQQIIDCAGPILYAGVLSCGLGYTFQIIGQKDTNPTVASLIMSLESVFSAISGYIILNNVLSHRELFGCLLIFSGVILSQLPQKKT